MEITIYKVCEILGILTGLVCVWFNSKQNIWGWPTGILSVAFYAVVFYDVKLYADMGLQVVFFFLSVYGWYEWLYGGKNKHELVITLLPTRLVGWLLLIGILSAALLGYLLDTYTDASLPYMDASTTVTSMIAQWMLARKYLENWLVWIAVDIVYVGMFLYKNLHLSLTAGLYAVYLVLATMGYLSWKKAMAPTV